MSEERPASTEPAKVPVQSEERPASTEPAKVPVQSDRSALVAHLYTANSRLELELSVARMSLDQTQSLLRITLFGMTAGLLVILILAALITLSITWRQPEAPTTVPIPAPPTKPAVTTRKTMGFDPTHNPRAGGNTRNDPTKGPIESPAEPLPSPAKP